MAFRLDHKNVAADMEVRQDVSFLGQRDVLVDLLRHGQAAETLADYLELHAMLLARYAGRQSVREERRVEDKKDVVALRALTSRTPRSLGQIRELQRRLTVRARQDRRDGLLLHHLRTIADAMVWRLLGCERRAVAVLGDGRRVKRVALGTGFHEELRQIEQWERGGAVAVHNDLTTCLRHGDLTVFRPPFPPAEVGIAEVKVPGQRGGHGRQRHRLDARLRMLAMGVGATSDGSQTELVQLGVAYRTHLVELSRIVARARADGYAEQHVEAGMLAVAVDLGRFEDPEGELGDWMLAPARRHGWTPEDERHFGGSALVAATRERHANSSCLAPIPLFPLTAPDLADLLLGRVDYVVTIRAEELERAFARRGIEARVVGGREAEETFLHAGRGPHSVSVSALVREQMLRELMAFDCLVDAVEALFDMLDAGASIRTQRMIFFDERAGWPVSPVAPDS